MSETNPLSFLQNIRTALPKLHPTERRLAEFLLCFPGDIASYSASEVAVLANVSNATVSRFIKKLGYANYDAARKIARFEQKTGAALFKVTSGKTPPDQILALHLQQAQSGLQNTFSQMTPVEVDALASSILGCGRVFLVGFRTSHAFAVYLQTQIHQVVENAIALPRIGQTLAESIATIGPEDCVVFFGLARRIQSSNEILSQIKNSNAAIAYVTDEMVERDVQVNWHFRCNTVATGPLFSHVSVMALVHLIATRVIELAGPEARKRLSKIEVLHDALGEL